MLIDLRFDFRIQGECHGRSRQFTLRNRLGDGKILIDHVGTAGHDPARVPQARRGLTWLGRSIDRWRFGPASEDGRTNRALQIDRDLVVRFANIVPHGGDLLHGWKSKERFPPVGEPDGVNPVDQRPLGRARAAAW